jgi:hypothetical protein
MTRSPEEVRIDVESGANELGALAGELEAAASETDPDWRVIDERFCELRDVVDALADVHDDLPTLRGGDR